MGLKYLFLHHAPFITCTAKHIKANLPRIDDFLYKELLLFVIFIFFLNFANKCKFLTLQIKKIQLSFIVYHSKITHVTTFYNVDRITPVSLWLDFFHNLLQLSIHHKNLSCLVTNCKQLQA